MSAHTLYIPDPHWQRIVDAAKAEGLSISEWLRKAADERIKRQAKRGVCLS